MDRIRVAALQYFIRPVASWEQFRDQVLGLIETAADYKCHLIVFPEYFTLQLLTLAHTRRPIQEQLSDLARQVPRLQELMRTMARTNNLYVVAGTIPVFDESTGRIHNECFVFGPDGTCGVQGKLHMTRFEREEWDVAPRSSLRVFETAFGRMAFTSTLRTPSTVRFASCGMPSGTQPRIRDLWKRCRGAVTGLLRPPKGSGIQNRLPKCRNLPILPKRRLLQAYRDPHPPLAFGGPHGLSPSPLSLSRRPCH